MGCSCQGPKAYQVEIDGQNYIIWSLDEIIFSTIFAQPTDLAEAEQMLWEKLCVFNPKIDPSLEFVFKRALVQMYKDTKMAYEEYQMNQAGISD